MDRMTTMAERARSFQRELTMGFNYASVTPLPDGKGFKIEVTSGHEDAIRQKADAVLGAGMYELKMPGLAIGK
jgi:hypothetical protein